MEKALSVESSLAEKVPSAPGVNWDEIHEEYVAKLEQDRLAAGDARSEEERFLAAINDGLADIRAGHTVALEEARAWMEKKFGTPR